MVESDADVDDAVVVAEPVVDATPAGVALTVCDAAAADVDRAIIRLDPSDLRRLGARSGDLIEIVGREEASRATYARALPAGAGARAASSAFLDGVQRSNVGVGLGETVYVRRVAAAPATTLRLRIDSGAARIAPWLAARIQSALEATPAAVGDAIRIRLVGGRALMTTVVAAEPSGPVVISNETELLIEVAGGETASTSAEPAETAPYAELGGLDAQIAAVREMVELPMTRPDLFERLGLDAPKGVLFTGPPGSGKTLLARAVARTTKAAFFQLNGPEIVSKHYGDSEGRLREIFKKAGAQRPSIVFIDELDAIAPKRDDMAGDRQLERRIVAQLLTLLDGLSERNGVIVMAATNLPDSLDPALRRPGRFDREIAFGPPDRDGRAAILRVHTRAAPLADDVDLDDLAGRAHGFVGADLAALVREAGLAALRRVRSEGGGYPADAAAIEIAMADFETALGAVRPSAVREVFTETPDVRWSDVGGLGEVKDVLIEAVIWPLRHRDAYRRLGLEAPKGVLLSGQPGAGKTHLARALAHEAGVNFIAIRGAQLLSRHLGDSERAVRDVFAKARQAAPCIVFFDEIDAIAPARGDGVDKATARVVATLLTEIDGVEELRGVFLLGATNRVDQIDDALLRPGRFDRVLRLEAPNLEMRREILAIHTRALPLDRDVSLDRLAAATEGMVGADLKSICQAAGRHALRRWLTSGAAEAEAEAFGSTTVGGPQASTADFSQALSAQWASDANRGRLVAVPISTEGNTT